MSRSLLSAARPTALVGLLTGLLVGLPASVAAAPDGRKPGCSPYPASVATTVLVDLERPIGIFGQRTRAAVTVHRGGASTAAPGGRVRLLVLDSDGAQVASRDARLRRGSVVVALPRRLPAEETYTVRARYAPPRCSVLSADAAPDAHYSVFPAQGPRGR